MREHTRQPGIDEHAVALLLPVDIAQFQRSALGVAGAEEHPDRVAGVIFLEERGHGARLQILGVIVVIRRIAPGKHDEGVAGGRGTGQKNGKNGDRRHNECGPFTERHEIHHRPKSERMASISRYFWDLRRAFQHEEICRCCAGVRLSGLGSTDW